MCHGVARLVEAKVATARKSQRAQEAPPFITDGAACDALFPKLANLCLHIVAHEIELMPAVTFGGMAGNLGRRYGEDQPTATRVNGGKPQHVAEKSPIRLSVAGIDDRVHAYDH